MGGIIQQKEVLVQNFGADNRKLTVGVISGYPGSTKGSGQVMRRKGCCLPLQKTGSSFRSVSLIDLDSSRCSINCEDFNVLHERPCTEPYARWGGSTREVTPSHSMPISKPGCPGIEQRYSASSGHRIPGGIFFPRCREPAFPSRQSPARFPRPGSL